MIAVLLVVVTAILVVAVGLVFVGSAVNKTAQLPDQIVVDAHDAIEFCAEAVPVRVSSVLTYEDLRKILRLHLEWIQAYDVAPEGSNSAAVVFEEFDPVDYIIERATVNRFDIQRDHVAAVVEAHSSFLQVMGAIHIDDPLLVNKDLAALPLLDAPTTAAPGLLEMDRTEVGDVPDFGDQEEGGGPTD